MAQEPGAAAGPTPRQRPPAPAWSPARPPTGGAGLTARPPKRSGGVAIVVLVVVLAMVALAVTLVVQQGDEPADTASPTTPTAADPATTTPRHTDPYLLDRYCEAPGQAWPEVPPHVAGEPGRLQVHITSAGPSSNGSDEGDFPRALSGGSTVLSPQTDGRFTSEPLVLPRTRAVACVAYLGRQGTGRSCPYVLRFQGSRDAADFTLELAQDRYEIVVYELRSGGVLHRGEIASGVEGCPDEAVDRGTGRIVRRLDDDDVLAWIGSHFVDGRPA